MRAALLLAIQVGLLCAADPLVGETARVRADFLAAIDAAPEVKAALARWRAAGFAATGAATLPDPQVWAEGMRRDDMDGLEVGVEQELPRWGERSAQRGVAAAETARARVELDRTRAGLAREISMLIAKAQASRRRAELAEQSAARMRSMAAITETVVAAGGMEGSGAGDVLALRTRIEQMELMAADERRMAVDAEDDARGCCGLDAGAPLPDMLLPDPATLERSSDTMSRMARSEAQMAKAELAMARSRRWPMVGVGAAWEREDLASDEQAWKVMLSLSIPVQQESFAGVERAAHARALAAQSEADLADLRIDIGLRRARRAVEQADQARVAVAAARLRTEAEFIALREQMAAGSSTAVMRALSRLDDLQDAERAAIAADAEAAAMSADLWTLYRFPEP